MKSKSEIAFLVYGTSKKRFMRKNNYFDANYNFGAKVIIDILQKNKIVVEYCSCESAYNYKIILVSFTSTYDVYEFYKSVAFRPEWQRKNRKFDVVAGGFGLQNPYTIRNFIDIGVFGRAESLIVSLIENLLKNEKYNHESVMYLPDIYKVKISQAQKLYCSDIFDEEFIGCPGRCMFCHYTWARERIGKTTTYIQDRLANGNMPEILFKDIVEFKSKKGRIRTAIDGFSERLRLAYGKKITNDMLIDNIHHLGSFGGTTVILCYNIGNFPGETNNDIVEFNYIMNKIKPKNTIILILHTTPFRPSLATPMQFASVNLYPSYSKCRAQKIINTDKFVVEHSISNEGPFKQLMSIIVERASEKTDKLFHAICFSSKLKSASSDDAVTIIKNNFDLTPYLREYDYGEHPGWFLESYIDSKKMYDIWEKKKIE